MLSYRGLQTHTSHQSNSALDRCATAPEMAPHTPMVCGSRCVGLEHDDFNAQGAKWALCRTPGRQDMALVLPRSSPAMRMETDPFT